VILKLLLAVRVLSFVSESRVVDIVAVVDCVVVSDRVKRFSVAVRDTLLSLETDEDCVVVNVVVINAEDEYETDHERLGEGLAV